MDLTEYERIHPNVEIEGMRFFTPNSHCAWRIQTLRSKEPDTIAWIESMPTDALFFDIGANIGQYTVFAAHRGLRVHAFEPESQNFALLCRNIALNGYQNVTAWPVCLDIGTKLEQLHLSALLPGGSCHAFGEPLDYHGKPKDFAFHQGSISVSLDRFADQYGLPDYIKIDVDGFEHRVCAAAHRCLTNAKSVLVEINTHYAAHNDLVTRLIADYGFKTDDEQIALARRTSGPFTGIGNIIFFRGDSWK